MKRIAIIGDIVESRKVKNRAVLQKDLQKIFRQINKSSKTLVSPYTITLGDEFQALYNSANEIFRDILKVIGNLYPVKIKFSIGIGEITTSINKQQAIGMDGPAFHNARAGLNELKKLHYYFNIKSVDEIRLIRNSLFLVSHLMGNWKASRYEITNLYLDGYNVKKIAKKTKLTDKAIYKNLDAGEIDLIKNIFEDIAIEINDKIKN